MKNLPWSVPLILVLGLLGPSSVYAARIEPIELIAPVSAGGTATPAIANPDGSQSPFAIPAGMAFVVTDISIQRLSVVAGPGTFSVSLEQDIPTSGTTNRWSFVGSMSQNEERPFTTGIEFTTSFRVANASSSDDAVNVRLFGHFEKAPKP